MTFGGVWSKVLMSPAAHQIHHSTNPKHFDRNFGGAFAFWDWLFGTLYVPVRDREVHEVGLKDDRMRDSFFLTMIHPFHEVISRVADLLPPRVVGKRKAD
jgi:sterol desaturase/sphingolipid hydroxylase (fatty acid hydroxylase superfamily)